MDYQPRAFQLLNRILWGLLVVSGCGSDSSSSDGAAVSSSPDGATEPSKPAPTAGSSAPKPAAGTSGAAGSKSTSMSATTTTTSTAASAQAGAHAAGVTGAAGQAGTSAEGDDAGTGIGMEEQPGQAGAKAPGSETRTSSDDGLGAKPARRDGHADHGARAHVDLGALRRCDSAAPARRGLECEPQSRQQARDDLPRRRRSLLRSRPVAPTPTRSAARILAHRACSIARAAKSSRRLELCLRALLHR